MENYQKLEKVGEGESSSPSPLEFMQLAYPGEPAQAHTVLSTRR